MTLDPSIILQAGKGVTKLLTPDEIQEQQMTRELGGMKLAQARQGIADDQAYRQVLQSGATGADQISALQKAGLGKQAMEASKFQTEQQKAQAERGKLVAEGMKNGAAMILANPTEQNAIETLTMAQQQYGLPQQMVDGAKAKIYAARNDPNALKQLAVGWGGDAEKVLGKIETVNLGGSTAFVRNSPISGPSMVGSMDRTQSPDSAASVAQSDINNRRSVDASLTNAAATREVAGATRDAASIKSNRETEMKLGDDYRAQSKDFRAVGDAYRQITSTLDKATTSPAATLAAATKFMKLLDPGSVVRESELGMALQASGVLDRATNYFNILQRGKVLTPTQVADFKNITQQIYGAAQEGQKAIDADYRQKAQTYGLRPEMIVQELGQTNAPKAEKPKTKPMNIDGKDFMAELAPDGKYYVQQNGKWFEVR